MQDPTREEMLSALKPLIAQMDNDADSAEIAIYWFASDWHGGQASNLYSVLSTSPYSPGPATTLDSEGESVAWMYEQLEADFR